MQTHEYKASAVTIEGLFTLRSVAYAVPSYQRRYKWGDQQISDLISDLYDEEDQEWLTGQKSVVPG